MTTRPHPHLSAVGPTVRALPIVGPARIGAPRPRAVALVAPLPLRDMIPKRAQNWVLAGVGVVFVVAALLSTPDPTTTTVEVRSTWTEAAGFPVERPPTPANFAALGR